MNWSAKYFGGRTSFKIDNYVVFKWQSDQPIVPIF
jgi:hypothetical protein